MNKYFEIKVKYDKELESGKIKAVSENYIVDAMTFTEAEARIIAEMQTCISGEFDVQAIKKSRFNEVIESPKFEYFFKVVVAYTDVDEKTGKEKTTKENVLIKADDLNHAEEIAREQNKDILVPWSIVKCELSNILDYIETVTDIHELNEAKVKEVQDAVIDTSHIKCSKCEHGVMTNLHADHFIHCEQLDRTVSRAYGASNGCLMYIREEED